MRCLVDLLQEDCKLPLHEICHCLLQNIGWKILQTVPSMHNGARQRTPLANTFFGCPNAKLQKKWHGKLPRHKITCSNRCVLLSKKGYPRGYVRFPTPIE